MAKFCGKCGTGLDGTTGLCPRCDAEQLARLRSIPNFCTVCGGAMDKHTGTCPNCADAVVQPPVEVFAPPAVPVEEPVQPQKKPNFCTVCGGTMDSKTGECPRCAEADSQLAAMVPLAEQVAGDLPESAEQTREKSKNGKRWVTVVLAFPLYLLLLLVTVLFSVRQATSQDGIQAMLQDMQPSALIGMLGLDGGAEEFCNNLSEYLEVPISLDELDEFAEESTLKEFAAAHLGAYAEDLYTGDDAFSLKTADVEEFLYDNHRVVEKVFDVSLTETEIREISDWLIDEETVDRLSVNALKSDVPAVFYGLHIGLSYLMVGVLLLLAILCLFFMLKNKLSLGIYGFGIVLCVIGGVAGLATLFAALVPSLWELMCGHSLVGFAVGQVLCVNGALYGIVFATGVVVLIASFLIVKFLKRRCEAATA